jgi:hypothetical protein
MIDQLITNLRTAKAVETAAKNERLRIEAEMVKLFAAPVSGEGSHNDEEFVIKWEMTRSVDTDALQNGYDGLNANAQKAFRWKADVDLKQLRALQELDEVAYTQAAQYITNKPAKPSLKLKD